ncbi:hypothetical protein [Thermococcus sp. JCM 11816]|uniref:hypothetical protein n=1 Tax=Thermococcus sp. (strain JCM 11816 / KS-1) TaxID=1295125 RepID=UPI000A845ED6
MKKAVFALLLIGLVGFSVVASGCIGGGGGGSEKIKILYTYTGGSFGDAAKGKQATQAQLQQGGPG